MLPESPTLSSEKHLSYKLLTGAIVATFCGFTIYGGIGLGIGVCGLAIFAFVAYGLCSEGRR